MIYILFISNQIIYCNKKGFNKMKRKKKNDLKATLLSGFGRIAGDIIDGLSSQEVMCGTYADGTPRSFIDALRGDYRQW